MHYRAATCLTLCLLMPALLCADQTFKVSRELGLVSTNLNMIVNPLNGDIYVLITQLDVDNRSYSRVFGSLIRNQPQTKNFAPGTPRLLSADSGWQGRATGIFALSIKRFVIVWDERGVEGPERATRIFGRQVSTAGKPKGAIATVLDNGDSNDYPQIIDLFEDDCDDDPPPINHQFFLAWNGNRPAGGDDRPTHGLNIAPLNIGKKKISIQAEYFTSIESNKEGAGVGPYPEISSGWARFRSGEESLGVTLSGTRYVDNGGAFKLQGFSYRLDIESGTGLASESSRLDTPIGLAVPHTIGVSSSAPRWDELFAVAYNTGTSRLDKLLYQDDQWSAQEEIAIKDFTAFAGQVIRPPCSLPAQSPGAAPAAKPVFGHLVMAANDGWVYAQRITADGKFLKKPVKIFSHGNALQSMRVYRLTHDDSAFNTVILWQKKVNENMHEAWAYFTNLQ